MIKGSWRGAGPFVCNPADEVLRQAKGGGRQNKPAGTNSFIYIKGASHLCIDIYMHGFPTRFIFFINMFIQVQALHNTTMGTRDYII